MLHTPGDVGTNTATLPVSAYLLCGAILLLVESSNDGALTGHAALWAI
jgi:hypothetical protein